MVELERFIANSTRNVKYNVAQICTFCSLMFFWCLRSPIHRFCSKKNWFIHTRVARAVRHRTYTRCEHIPNELSNSHSANAIQLSLKSKAVTTHTSFPFSCSKARYNGYVPRLSPATANEYKIVNMWNRTHSETDATTTDRIENRLLSLHAGKDFNEYVLRCKVRGRSPTRGLNKQISAAAMSVGSRFLMSLASQRSDVPGTYLRRILAYIGHRIWLSS